VSGRKDSLHTKLKDVCNDSFCVPDTTRPTGYLHIIMCSKRVTTCVETDVREIVESGDFTFLYCGFILL